MTVSPAYPRHSKGQTVTAGTCGTAYTISIAGDGSIFLAGTTAGSGASADAVIHLSSSGSVDTSFGSSGELTFHTGSCSASEAIRASVWSSSDDTLYLTGANATNGSYFVARITTSGSCGLDPNFYANGYYVRCSGSAWSWTPYAITLQGDGEVVVAGMVAGYNGGYWDTTSGSGSGQLYNNSMFAMRFMHEQDEEQNLIDGNFHSGSESVVTLGTSGNSAAYGVAQLSGGKIELAGSAVVWNCGAGRG
ncbi:MAG: hypothetical protein ACHRHE_11615 [Tepidisphaerales bacterium]